jgi:cell wall assembly regulator SMI1
MNVWVQRLLDFTERESAHFSSDPDAVEREMGIPLPDDYKELWRAFGGGAFGGSVYFLAQDDGQVFDLLTQWRAALAADRSPELGDVSAVAPHTVYSPGGKGLVPWGSTEWGDEYFWSVDAATPADYAILARVGDSDRWHRFAFSTAEFLYRVVADPEFRPFGVARYGLAPRFEPAGEEVG